MYFLYKNRAQVSFSPYVFRVSCCSVLSLLDIAKVVDLFSDFMKMTHLAVDLCSYFCLVSVLLAELLARAKRAQSGAPWVRKFGKLSI